MIIVIVITIIIAIVIIIIMSGVAAHCIGSHSLWFSPSPMYGHWSINILFILEHIEGNQTQPKKTKSSFLLSSCSCSLLPPQTQAKPNQNKSKPNPAKENKIIFSAQLLLLLSLATPRWLSTIEAIPPR